MEEIIVISVQLKYNPYIPLLEILFNGIPISRYSTLRNYCKASFEVWSKIIFQSLYAELNDYFEIEYTGQYDEYDILRLYAANCSYCGRITFVQPNIAETPIQRLRLLNNMVLTGTVMLPQKTKVNVNFISQGEWLQQVRFPKLSYCMFKQVNIQTTHEAIHTSDDINIAICQSRSECENAMRQYHNNAHYVICDSSSGKLLINDYIVFGCEPTAINNAVMDIMNVFHYPQLLRAIILQNRIDTAQNETCGDLLRLDPEIRVALPKELEVGVETKVTIYGIDNIERIQLRRTGLDFVSYSNGVLCAHDTGIAHIELIDMNTNSVVATGDICCLRKRHITRMLFQHSRMVMTVGEHRTLPLITEPIVNDDMNRVKFMSDDPFIAYELNGEIYAKEEGVCTISATCGTVFAQCVVEVYPRIKDIIINPSKVEMKIGGVTKISIDQVPKESLPRTYSVSISPNDIVDCDISSRMIQANKVGVATIEISVGDISKDLKITVHPKDSSTVLASSGETTDDNTKINFWSKLFKRR